MTNGAMIGAIFVLSLGAIGAVYVSSAAANPTHAEYLRDTYQITADYAEALEGIETMPPEVGLAFALSAEHVLSGPEDVQWLIARGEYRAVRARIRSMRRDLVELQTYQANR